ncbi:MAG TPA: IPT/TIG domain-containing protein, partial [Thermoanaerobaculia bacterium]|nr:IPT/TIG domain-containing protein [Thermoanaerobaculia bacterium]
KEPPKTLEAQQQAVLQGLNLQKVTLVLFGNQTATISSVLPNQLVVKIPPKDVPAGQKEQVPIVFQTDQGAIPTGFTFEYTGPPLPKKEKTAKDWRRTGSTED